MKWQMLYFVFYLFHFLHQLLKFLIYLLQKHKIIISLHAKWYNYVFDFDNSDHNIISYKLYFINEIFL